MSGTAIKPHDGVVLVVAAVPQELSRFRPSAGVRTLLTGMGCARARTAVGAFVQKEPVSRILSVGFCGGLDPALKAGQPVWVDSVTSLEGSSRRQAAVWRGKMKSEWPQAVLLTVDCPVKSPSEKSVLRGQSSAHVVDMETYAIAEIAERNGIPWNGLRVVLDPADQVLEIDSPLAAIRMLAWPAEWKRLSSFLKQLRSASTVLADSLNELAN